MAHWAQIDENNIVLNILRLDDSIDDGHEYLSSDLGIEGRFIKTSYNTYHNEHRQGGIPLRKNYATIGGTYNEELDAFIPPQPWPSWILDENVCDWIPATVELGNRHWQEWDEENQTWLY